MTRRLSIAAVFVLAGCGDWPGKPVAVVAPAAGSREAFDANYAVQCAACHGANGTNGGARPLNDPLYLAVIPEESFLAAVAHGQGILMPAYAAAEGGPWDKAALKTFVDGAYRFWGSSGGLDAATQGPLPSYALADGNAQAGAAVFASWCGACHGSDGAGLAGAAPGPEAVDGGSVVDSFYLRLISDQGLRSAVLFGHADLGMPAYRGPFPGHGEAMLDEESINNITAWLKSRKRAEAIR